MQASTSSLRALALHLEAVSKNNRRPGSSGWTYDDEIPQLNAAAQELEESRRAKRDESRRAKLDAGQVLGESITLWQRIEPARCDCCNRVAIFRHPEGGLRCDKCHKPDKT